MTTSPVSPASVNHASADSSPKTQSRSSTYDCAVTGCDAGRYCYAHRAANPPVADADDVTIDLRPRSLPPFAHLIDDLHVECLSVPAASEGG